MSRFEGTGAYYFQSLDPREPDTDSRTGEDNEYDYEDGFLVHDDEEEQEFQCENQEDSDYSPSDGEAEGKAAASDPRQAADQDEDEIDSDEEPMRRDPRQGGLKKSVVDEEDTTSSPPPPPLAAEVASADDMERERVLGLCEWSANDKAYSLQELRQFAGEACEVELQWSKPSRRSFST